jgi:phosphatidylethanolamine/phosphatidyl-N-methylethanolamine N-methyltransferase
LKSISKAAVLRVYSWYAPIYDLVFGRVLEAGRIELAKSVASHRPHRLLEVGVGTGLALLHYPAELQVYGVDISLDMLRHAQLLVANHELANAGLLCADAEQLPFPDSSFDCVALPYVLSVTPDPERLLAETRRVCTPDGRIFVLNHFAGAGGWRIAERLVAPIADRVGFCSTLAMDILENPNWEILNVGSVNLLGLSKLVEIRNAHD